MEIVERMIADKLALADKITDPVIRTRLLNDVEWMQNYLVDGEDEDDSYSHLGETYEG